jgi:hypothetical protein
MRVEVNVRAGEIEMFAQAGERWAINGVAVSGEQLVHVFPIPAAAPRAVHDDAGELFAGSGLRRRGWGIRFAPDECGEAGESQGQADEEWLVYFHLRLQANLTTAGRAVKNEGGMDTA